jgi:hypothetical protein
VFNPTQWGTVAQWNCDIHGTAKQQQQQQMPAVFDLFLTEGHYFLNVVCDSALLDTWNDAFTEPPRRPSVAILKCAPMR